ncbi:unnamed protein product [Schistosoma margrebowiei]|uniref:Uncharacterized protein n=1 Tax=Schistosoma margrebowiei TaxID=48269 RepID=A0A183M0L8_9TREM|nr:unnamed protein product [Schistosoma margrebowiei]
MKTSTSEGKHGIRWTVCTKIDDLGFADDQSLQSHTYEQMKVKKTSVAEAYASVDINVHKVKTKILNHNSKSTKPVTFDKGASKTDGNFHVPGQPH